MVALTMIFGWNPGAMRKYTAAGVQSSAGNGQPAAGSDVSPVPSHSSPITSLLVIVPVLVLVATMLISLAVTGEGSMLKGDGTASVFYAALAAIAVLALMVQFRPKAERPSIEKSVYSGIGDFVEVGILLALALTLGSLCKEMGTGVYIAGLAQGNVPTFLMPLIFFFVGCLISLPPAPRTGHSASWFRWLFLLLKP